MKIYDNMNSFSLVLISIFKFRTLIPRLFFPNCKTGLEKPIAETQCDFIHVAIQGHKENLGLIHLGLPQEFRALNLFEFSVFYFRKFPFMIHNITHIFLT